MRMGDFVRLVPSSLEEEISSESYFLFDSTEGFKQNRVLPGLPIGTICSKDLALVLEIVYDSSHKPSVKVLVNGAVGWLTHHIKLEDVE